MQPISIGEGDPNHRLIGIIDTSWFPGIGSESGLKLISTWHFNAQAAEGSISLPFSPDGWEQGSFSFALLGAAVTCG